MVRYTFYALSANLINTRAEKVAGAWRGAGPAAAEGSGHAFDFTSYVYPALNNDVKKWSVCGIKNIGTFVLSSEFVHEDGNISE